jgi:hypothetical protein
LKECGPKIGVYRRRYNHELDVEFNSPNPGHLIRRLEDLPKKPHSEPNPMEGEIKEDRNPGGRLG